MVRRFVTLGSLGQFIMSLLPIKIALRGSMCLQNRHQSAVCFLKSVQALLARLVLNDTPFSETSSQLYLLGAEHSITISVKHLDCLPRSAKDAENIEQKCFDRCGQRNRTLSEGSSASKSTPKYFFCFQNVGLLRRRKFLTAAFPSYTAS